jgi:hypothetical protein
LRIVPAVFGRIIRGHDDALTVKDFEEVVRLHRERVERIEDSRILEAERGCNLRVHEVLIEDKVDAGCSSNRFESRFRRRNFDSYGPPTHRFQLRPEVLYQKEKTEQYSYHDHLS